MFKKGNMEKTTILFNSVRLFESFEKAPTQKAVKKSGLKVNETEPNEQIAWENNKRLTWGKRARDQANKTSH